jgi:uncharacterized damage-inducible protein DinB
MSYAETLLPEFDQEMASTRKVLAQVPDDKLEWRAHPKSNTIGWNASHLANIPSWIEFTLNSSSLDVAPPGGESFKTPQLASRKALLDEFDKNVAAGRKTLTAATDEKMGQMWSLLQGGKTLFTMPKSAVIRSFVLNHIIHHRAILCVYLRLNDIPVPGMYGPSGDDPK